jgi:hypothetical protein
MALNTTTNFIVRIDINTAFTSESIVTAVAVPQEFKVKNRSYSFGNTSISNGTITKSFTPSVKTNETNSGTVDEVQSHLISAILPFDKNVKIATITTFTISTSYAIRKKISLSLNKIIPGVEIFLKETPYTGLTSGATFDLICRTSRSISGLDNLVVSANQLVGRVAQEVTTALITRVDAGSLNLSRDGETRNIKIHGDPQSSFYLTIEDGSDRSIIANPTEGGRLSLPSGEREVVKSKLNRAGVFVHKQRFPKIPTILTTAVNGSMAASGATKIIFDSLSGVQVGDTMVVSDTRGRKINNGETVKVVTLNPDGDNANECTLSSSVTLADDKKVAFVRSTTFKVHVTPNPDTAASYGPKLIDTVYPMFTLSQNVGTTVTFNASASAPIQINGGSAGVSHSVAYGSNNSNIRDINLVYTLTGKTFTQATGKPILRDFVIASGDAIITGTVRGTGGGTTTYKVIANLNIEYKTTDTVVNINMDNIVS